MDRVKREFTVLNIKCGGCAGTVKKALLEEFGEVEVNLEVEPRIISLLTDENFDEALDELLEKSGELTDKIVQNDK